MSLTILALGAVAGLTIFLGLPVARLRNPSVRLRAFLSAAATGVLLFLLWDVLSKSVEPAATALGSLSRHNGSWGPFALYAGIFVVALTVGLMGLVYYERWMAQRVARLASAGQESGHSPSRRLALMIAIGIGAHNFSEGLAIGQSAAAGSLSLALVLIIGFALHNATEGFGIVGPLTGHGERPDWKFLALLGLIGGLPTTLGTVIGQLWVNPIVFVAFLALAAGSILYVVVQLVHVGSKLGRRELMMWGILAGLLAGFGTDFVLTAAGV